MHRVRGGLRLGARRIDARLQRLSPTGSNRLEAFVFCACRFPRRLVPVDWRIGGRGLRSPSVGLAPFAAEAVGKARQQVRFRYPMTAPILVVRQEMINDKRLFCIRCWIPLHSFAYLFRYGTFAEA